MIRLPFQDRFEAGCLLGAELAARNLPKDTIVLGLARGGVAVGSAVASALGAPLDVVVVRKIGVPWQPELAMGAVAGGKMIFDEELIRELGVSIEEIESAVARATMEAERRAALYRRGAPAPNLDNRTVVLVDDGLATGSSMLAAVRYVKSLQPAAVIAAVPVGSTQACRQLKSEADDCVCLVTPEPFHAVGEWYLNFEQVSDSEVRSLLAHRE